MVLPFLNKCFSAQFEKNGTTIGGMYELIAAHARSRGLVLVTNNAREFCKVEGLEVENWVE